MENLKLGHWWVQTMKWMEQLSVFTFPITRMIMLPLFLFWYSIYAQCDATFDAKLEIKLQQVNKMRPEHVRIFVSKMNLSERSKIATVALAKLTTPKFDVANGLKNVNSSMYRAPNNTVFTFQPKFPHNCCNCTNCDCFMTFVQKKYPLDIQRF